MSTDRDVERIVRSWMDEGVTALPDRVLDLVLDQIPATPQRRAGWLARRFPFMNQALRLGIAAVVVAAAAFIGFRYLVEPNIGSDPNPSATPASSPMSLTEDFLPLEAGLHMAGDPFLVPLTFTVPSGWEGKIGGEYFVDTGIVGKPSGLQFAIFNAVAGDPCRIGAGFVDLPGQSVDDLAIALANMPGVEVTGVSDTLVDGYSGTRLTLTAPDSFAGCTLGPDGYVLWQLPGGTNFSIGAGQRFELWILDVAGERLVILVPHQTLYTDADNAQVQSVFDSIHIEP